MHNIKTKRSQEMARQPLYPRSAGETAIDKLVNQTIPRLIQSKEARNEREEVRAENDRRYKESQIQRTQDKREQRGLYIDDKLAEINESIASGDVKGLEFKIDQLDNYQTLHGRSDFNPVDLKQDAKQSLSDYDALNNAKQSFYRSKTSDETITNLGTLEDLVTKSGYINEEDINFAYERIANDPENEAYEGLYGVGKFDPKQLSAHRITTGAYYLSQTESGLMTTAQVTAEIVEMNKDYLAELEKTGKTADLLTSPDHYKASSLYVVDGKKVTGADIARSRIYSSERVQQIVMNNQESFRGEFLSRYDDNVADYLTDENGELDVNQFEKELIDNSGVYWATVDAFGLKRANDIKLGKEGVELTAAENLKVSRIMVDRLSFPEEYATMAKEELNKVKGDKKAPDEVVISSDDETLDLHLDINKNLQESIASGEGPEQETKRITTEEALEAQKFTITEADVKVSGNIDGTKYNELALSRMQQKFGTGPLNAGDKVILDYDAQKNDVQEYESQANELFDLLESAIYKIDRGEAPNQKEKFVLDNLDLFPKTRGPKEGSLDKYARKIKSPNIKEIVESGNMPALSRYRKSVVSLAKDEARNDAKPYLDYTTGKNKYIRWSRDDNGNPVEHKGYKEQSYATNVGKMSSRGNYYWHNVTSRKIEILTEYVRASDGTYSLPKAKYTKNWNLFRPWESKNRRMKGEDFGLKDNLSEKEYKALMKKLRKEEAVLKRNLLKDRDIHFMSFEKLFDGTL